MVRKLLRLEFCIFTVKIKRDSFYLFLTVKFALRLFYTKFGILMCFYFNNENHWQIKYQSAQTLHLKHIENIFNTYNPASFITIGLH